MRRGAEGVEFSTDYEAVLEPVATFAVAIHVLDYQSHAGVGTIDVEPSGIAYVLAINAHVASDLATIGGPVLALAIAEISSTAVASCVAERKSDVHSGRSDDPDPGVQFAEMSSFRGDGPARAWAKDVSTADLQAPENSSRAFEVGYSLTRSIEGSNSGVREARAGIFSPATLISQRPAVTVPAVNGASCSTKPIPTAPQRLCP